MDLDELEQKYQTAFLDEGIGDTARRSETATVRVGEEDLEIEVRSLTIQEFESTQIPTELRAEDGTVRDDAGVSQDRAQYIALIQKCVYIPGTDRRPFEGPGKAEQLTNVPYDVSGWMGKIIELIDYVHGFRQIPPEGVTDPKLREVAELAGDLKRIAEEEDELNPNEVARIADNIEGYIEIVANGSARSSGDEGNPTTG